MKLVRQKDHSTVSDDADVILSVRPSEQQFWSELHRARHHNRNPQASPMYIALYYGKIDSMASANGLHWILGHC